MKHRRELALFRKMLVGADLIVTVVAYLGAIYLRQWLAEGQWDSGLLGMISRLEVAPVDDPRRYHMTLVGLVPVWWIAFWLSKTSDFRLTHRQIFVRYTRAVAIGMSVFLLAVFLLKLHWIARSFVVMFGAANLLMLAIGRYVLMETVAFARSKRVDGHRVVVIGCGEQAARYAKSLRSQPPWNVRLLGHISVPGEQVSPAIGVHLGEVGELETLLNTTAVDEVLFAYPELDSEELANALHACDERGVDVLLPLPPSLPQRARVEIATIDGFDLPLLGLRRTPTSEVALAGKRALDLVGSAFGILFAGPVMLGTAILIKASSPGPVFFKQTRAGRNGRKFKMFKFRSMVVDAEAQKTKLMHLNEMSGPVFKITRDPRITRIGAFIRRTSIDELPQLFNIFMGDMSLVGPRPPLPSEVEQYKPWQRRRLSVKPGLTGLWQVSGRNNVDFEEWMALDLRYIDDWSLWLDVKIILRTVPAVLFKTGAS